MESWAKVPICFLPQILSFILSVHCFRWYTVPPEVPEVYSLFLSDNTVAGICIVSTHCVHYAISLPPWQLILIFESRFQYQLISNRAWIFFSVFWAYFCITSVLFGELDVYNKISLTDVRRSSQSRWHHSLSLGNRLCEVSTGLHALILSHILTVDLLLSWYLHCPTVMTVTWNYKPKKLSLLCPSSD